MSEIRQILTQERTTKGTVVYASDDPGVTIRQQYVAKSAFPDGQYPEKIELVIKAVA